jgi:hypothetical protein
MKINIKEIILSVLLILIIFNIGFYQTSKNSAVEICNKNINCIVDLIDNNENNSNYCEFSKDSSSCYETIAFTINSKFCNETKNSSKCFENNAVLKEEVELCEFVDNKDNCIFQLAANTNNETYCEKNEDKEKCYYSYALFKNDVSICEKTNNFQEQCIEKINQIN